MILTYHNSLSVADIKKECLANKKTLDAIFSDASRTRQFLRKVGIIPDTQTTKPAPGKTSKTAAAR